ncbi:hypothetical protein D918_05475 [Trichuris suis]|nr:hypothetical protein D918_05475 [Trichuris suis]
MDIVADFCNRINVECGGSNSGISLFSPCNYSHLAMLEVKLWGKRKCQDDRLPLRICHAENDFPRAMGNWGFEFRQHV